MKCLFLSFFSVLLFSGCNRNSNNLIKISGEAQGTTYQISYISNDNTDLKIAIDSIFKKIDSSLSAYLPVSIISRINKNDSIIKPDSHFIRVFNKSADVADRTGGVFDVTVAPVINAWGFGFSEKANVDSVMIDSLLQFIGYRMVRLQGNKLLKEKPGIMLDFNAIAQGYTVDVIAAYLEGKGVKNYFVELGGEVLAKGKKNNEEYWKVGIDKPDENLTEQRTIQAIIKLYNKAIATSGNYRKYYEEKGQKYSHIIDPKTGYPAKNNLLSASVIADDCMTADAYATAFMVMGLERSIQFLSENQELNLEAFFIYDENGTWKTFTSGNLKSWMELLP